MERMPKKQNENVGEEALRVIRGVLDGVIPADEVVKIGIRNATPETVEKVLEEHTNVTDAMKRDAKIADLKHNLKED